MKNFKTSLHILLTAASVLGFLGGWVSLAHAKKPAQTSNTAAQLDALPTLAPMPSTAIDGANSSGPGLFTLAPQQQAPLMRSRRAFFTTSGS